LASGTINTLSPVVVELEVEEDLLTSVGEVLEIVKTEDFEGDVDIVVEVVVGVDFSIAGGVDERNVHGVVSINAQTSADSTVPAAGVHQDLGSIVHVAVDEDGSRWHTAGSSVEVSRGRDVGIPGAEEEARGGQVDSVVIRSNNERDKGEESNTKKE